jgi:hypothetical protein
MASLDNLKVSEGEDGSLLKEEIQRLVDTAGWQLQNGDEIQKTYHCRTWTKISVRYGNHKIYMILMLMLMPYTYRTSLRA